MLLSLFLENIDEGVLFQKIIKKFELIEREEFNNQNEYDDAVIKLATELKILNQEDVEGQSYNENIKSYILKFRFDNIEKWKKALDYMVTESNKSVKKILLNRFRSVLASAKDFKIQKIEKYNNQIDNELAFYDNQIKNKIAYLSEQAKIARKLGIKKGIIASTDSKIIYLKEKDGEDLNLMDRDIYHHIYKNGMALEEEINLIKNVTIKSYSYLRLLC